jgi:hypothetical protein
MNLEARVQKLEKENRCMKRVGPTAIAVAILASLTMGAARKNYSAFDWVSAYGFTIRDEAVRDRGGLAYDPKIGPYFYLNDKKGQTKFKITLDGPTRE